MIQNQRASDTERVANYGRRENLRVVKAANSPLRSPGAGSPRSPKQFGELVDDELNIRTDKEQQKEGVMVKLEELGVSKNA